MKPKILFWASFAILSLSIIACKKEDNTEPPVVLPEENQTGSLKFMVEFMAGDNILNLNEDIITENSDTIQVTDLRFFISNLTLTDENGGYAIPESYHLATKSNGMSMFSFTVDSLPVASYTGISFGIGVDSVANHTNDHSGDLSPVVSQGMLWTWDTGYKFMKLEGTYRAQDGTNGAFTYHIGNDVNYKSFSISNPIQIKADTTTMVHFMADVLQIFTNPETINISELNTAHGTSASVIADNYSSGFLMLHHTEIMEEPMEMKHVR